MNRLYTDSYWVWKVRYEDAAMYYWIVKAWKKQNSEAFPLSFFLSRVPMKSKVISQVTYQLSGPLLATHKLITTLYSNSNMTSQLYFAHFLEFWWMNSTTTRPKKTKKPSHNRLFQTRSIKQINSKQTLLIFQNRDFYRLLVFTGCPSERHTRLKKLHNIGKPGYRACKSPQLRREKEKRAKASHKS